MVRLVQRDRELATIDALLDGASGGAGALALIEGPAGIGKTALVRVARDRAAERGMRVLHAVGTEFERDYPLGVARQCLEPVARSGGERLLHGPAKLAEPVLLGVPEPVEAAPVGLLHGLYWLVVNLADESPVLLAVDDAQWADEPSLRFLGYLARRLEALPVAVLVAIRTEDATPSVLDELRPAPARIDPPPLDGEGVQVLLGGVDERFARACHEATGGNPFLLDELVRALRADDVPFTADAAARIGTVTPPTVARTVAGTLARAGTGPAALARAASILGDGAALDVAAALAGLAMSDAGAAAAELVRAGLLEDATVLRFRHPILVRAVRAGVAAPERAAAHAHAAELLRARGAGPERVALQLLHAPPTGDQSVVDELRAAAVGARERGAPATAAVLLRRALAEPPAHGRRAAVLIELGQAELSTGEGASAGRHLEEAHGSAEDPVTRARALLLLSQAVPGEPQARRRLAERVEATLPEAERRDRDLALRLRAILVLAGRDEAPAVPGDTPAEAVYLSHLVLARMAPGARAADIADLALRAAGHPDALLEEGPYVLAFTGTVLGLRWSDRLDAAGRLVERAIATAQRRGSNAEFAIAMTHRAALARRAGRLRDAEADARSALGALLDQRWSFARGVVPLVGTLLDQGRTDDARAALAEAVGDGDIAEAPPLTPLVLARMALRAARGETGSALRDWEDALRRAGRMRGVNAGWMEDLEVAVGIYAALGQPDEAAASAAQAWELAEAWDTPGALGHARAAQARIAASDAERVELLREAVEHFARSPARYHEARARVNLGSALRRLGHRVQSRQPLREGYELAERCGAARLAETARAELRAGGIRLRRAAAIGVEALTPSERRIADMAAGGLSNPEIAQELFLTVKTVEMHLTHAYRKLDIHGRTEIADALAAKP